jgi:hypothetical protein
MTTEEPPRTGGSHRRAEREARLPVLLLSLVGVAIVAAGVYYALHVRGESAHSSASTPTPSATPTRTAASHPATPSGSPSTAPSTSAPPSATASTPSAAGTTSNAPTTTIVVARPALVVLNDSRINGLAAHAAGQFRAAGWTVASTGNYKGTDVPETTIFYPAGDLAAAQRLATTFHVNRVLAATSGMSRTDLTVVLAHDWRT